MADSRLARRSINQSKKQLYASLIGIFVVLFIALSFGPTLLGVVGSAIDKITGKSGQSAIIKSDADVQPPMIDPLPNATPSASISISGRSDYQNGEIELFINDRKEYETKVTDSQTFEFEDVDLSEGDNYIKARTVIGDKKSDFSEEIRVAYVKSAPKLEVTFPSDKQSFSKTDQQISVRGTTDPDNNITVNGFVAIVDNSGSFSYNLALNSGDNKLTVIATNQAGNRTEKELTVSYSE